MRHQVLVLLCVAVSCGRGSSGGLAPDPAPAVPAALTVSVEPFDGFDGEASYKGRLVALTYEEDGVWQDVLLAVYGDAVGPSVWDYEGAVHDAGDLFVTRSTDGGLTWSMPVNVTGTALLHSMEVDDDGLPETPVVAYAGDSGKPTVFAQGRIAVITWCDTYAPGGSQRSAVYAEAGAVEVPYSCVYAVRTVDGGVTWSAPEQLSDGSRDAIQNSVRGNGAGFAIVWQEDPNGLQPGEAEGPGDGGSGAHTTRGTDIWCTALSTSALMAGKPFPAARRVSDNSTKLDGRGYESGSSGASRPQVSLVGKTALVAYEETKGGGEGGGGGGGKFIRYHYFSAFDDSVPDPTAGRGWIVSDPAENGRRVRLVTQGKPGPGGMALLILWRQGLEGKGAPADVVGRMGLQRSGVTGSIGVLPSDLVPAVDPACDEPEAAQRNAHPMNLSSRFGLGAPTGHDPHENARAHRAILRGDSIAVAYTYATSIAACYNLHLRRSLDCGRSWDLPRSLSHVTDPSRNVFEPRLVGTPGSSDPAAPQNPDVFMVCWSTGEKDAVSGLEFTWTADFGETFAPVAGMAAGGVSQFESQVRLKPQGDGFSAVWMERDEDGKVNVMFRGEGFGDAGQPNPPEGQNSPEGGGQSGSGSGEGSDGGPSQP